MYGSCTGGIPSNGGEVTDVGATDGTGGTGASDEDGLTSEDGPAEGTGGFPGLAHPATINAKNMGTTGNARRIHRTRERAGSRDPVRDLWGTAGG